MDMLRVAGFAVAAAFAAAVVRRLRPEAGMALALGAGVMLLGVALTYLQGAVEALQRLCQAAQLRPAYVRALMKVVGVCLITEWAASICRDAEEPGLAQRVETVGRLMILALAAPVLAALLTSLLALAP